MVRLQTSLGMRLFVAPLACAALCAGCASLPYTSVAFADEASRDAATTAAPSDVDLVESVQGNASVDSACAVKPDDVDACLAGRSVFTRAEAVYALINMSSLPQELADSEAVMACVLECGKSYDVSALANLKVAYVVVPEGALDGLVSADATDSGEVAGDSKANDEASAGTDGAQTGADVSQAATDAPNATTQAVHLYGISQEQALSCGVYTATSLNAEYQFEGLEKASENVFAFGAGTSSEQAPGTSGSQTGNGEGSSAEASAAKTHLQAKVSLEGAELAANQFLFAIEPLDGAPQPELSQVSNDADGLIDFGEVAFSAPGDYTYRISQVPGDFASVTYDASSFDVVVHVDVDGQDGALTVSDPEVPTFSNEMDASGGSEEAALAPVTASLSTKVTLKGADLNAGAFQFKITLIDGAPEPTATMAVNTQDGVVDFGGATFTKPGTYTYKVVQVPGDAAGITYDDSVLTFTVVVEANADKTALVAQVTPSSTQGFVNSYKPVESAATQTQTSTAASEPYHAAAVIITASVSQPGGKSVAGSMSFDVVDDSGAVVTTGTNDANGTVRFSTIELSEAGEYTYTVRPAQGTSLSSVASSGETPSYRVTVKVEDTGTGLLATVSYPDGRPSFTASTAATKEKLSTSGSAATLESHDAAQQDASSAQVAVSPVVIAVAAVCGVVLAAAVACIVRLQTKGGKSNPAHAANGSSKKK